jgi:hypothetical protein
MLRGKNGGGLCTGVYFVTEDGRDQVGALREVAIKSADADARSVGNLSHRSIHSGGREHRLGRPQQRPEIAAGVGAHAPFHVALRLEVIAGLLPLTAHHAPN